jgi:aspartyl/asparaginyl beta-hydroxylase (cupin superfamily)
MGTADLKRYFLGNGILTWILSPFNLFVDLLSHRNKRIFELKDLPDVCQTEIKDLIQKAIRSKSKIISDLDHRMDGRKRGMIFFKWYGKNVETSMASRTFHQKHKFVNTIGFSTFGKNESTSIHYGPLRLTYRVLYNLNPRQDNRIYIRVDDQTHYWHQNPLIIFDDTLVHQSVNGSEHLRYVMFIDILRPSSHEFFLRTLLRIVRVVMMPVNRVFYGNWEMLR